MMLKRVPTEELRAEIERRRMAAEEAPPMLDKPDFEKIKGQAEYYMTYLAENLCEPKDGKHYIYESVITALYGAGAWDWINEIDE
jgi:hypothetical protein